MQEYQVQSQIRFGVYIIKELQDKARKWGKKTKNTRENFVSLNQLFAIKLRKFNFFWIRVISFLFGISRRKRITTKMKNRFFYFILDRFIYCFKCLYGTGNMSNDVIIKVLITSKEKYDRVLVSKWNQQIITTVVSFITNGKKTEVRSCRQMLINNLNWTCEKCKSFKENGNWKEHLNFK